MLLLVKPFFASDLDLFFSPAILCYNGAHPGPGPGQVWNGQRQSKETDTMNLRKGLGILWQRLSQQGLDARIEFLVHQPQELLF